MPDTLQSSAVRFAPRRLGHANLFVGELERSMRFYAEVCGLEEVRREPERWSRVVRQVGGLDKVDRGSAYAANFVSLPAAGGTVGRA